MLRTAFITLSVIFWGFVLESCRRPIRTSMLLLALVVLAAALPNGTTGDDVESTLAGEKPSLVLAWMGAPLFCSAR